MLFIDELLQSNKVTDNLKKQLRSAVIIQASNVARYYFQESDKEYWTMEDFPNIAPPFNHFWLDFTAPDFVNSSVRGITQWNYDLLPSKWGIRCYGGLATPPDELSTVEGRKLLMRDLGHDVDSMLVSVALQVPDFKEYINLDDEEIERVARDVNTSLDIKNVFLLRQLKDMLTQYVYMQTGKWDKVHEHWQHITRDFKWIVNLEYFVKEQQEVQPSKIWTWKLYVKDNGEIANYAGDRNMILATPEGEMLEAVERMVSRGIDFHEALHEARKATNPFLECASLAISFMHCKNVELNTVSPALKRVHNKSQKRRGEVAFQPVQYKELDIKPMKKVLHDEGQEHIVGTSKALHIMRGHFKTFEGKGLFGKHTGTYWWNDTLRGNAKRSTVKKYNIDLNGIDVDSIINSQKGN